MKRAKAIMLLLIVNVILIRQMVFTDNATAATMSKTEFFQMVANLAVTDYKNSKILPSVVTAQAIIETGWGQSDVMMRNHALFGVKATSSWTGGYYSATTGEYYGEWTTTTALFRAYPSFEECLADHTSILSQSRYSGVIGGTNYATVCNLLQSGGYATDPEYASKLISTIEANRLFEYDSPIPDSIDEYYRITLPDDDPDGGLVIRSAPGGSRLGVAATGSVVHITQKQYYSGQEWGYGTTQDGSVTGWMCIGLSGATQRVDGYAMPGNVWIELSSTNIALGSTMTYSWGADNATSYTLHLIVDGKETTVQSTGTSYQNVFNGTGGSTGEAYVVASNEHGSAESNHASFAIYAEGGEMAEGYDRIIPDGDYLIAAAGRDNSSSYYYLDIIGTEQPASNETNVNLYSVETNDWLPACDIWTLKYDPSDKCYTIKQMGTDMALDVYMGYVTNGTNVQAFESNGAVNQKWAISRSSGIGYRIQSKCSGMSLDIADNVIADGTNVRQCNSNDSSAQSWVFIPYQPSQPLPEGRYVLKSALSENVELDVSGDTYNTPNGANVQVWNDSCASQYNSFDVTKLSNGYYKLNHAGSGLALTVLEGDTTSGSNVVLGEDTGANSQQWSIAREENGYVLRARNSGYALDVADGATTDGTNVWQFSYNGTLAQIWTFEQAEHTVTLKMDEGEDIVQTKYYKNDLILSGDIPEKSGYRFLGWTTVSGSDQVEFYAGDVYSTDADAVLHPIFEALMRFDEADLVLPTQLTMIDKEAFAGLRVESINCPEGLEEIGGRAFADCVNLKYIYIPNTTLAIATDAFAGCSDLTIYGKAGSVAEAFARRKGFTFVECK